MVGRGCWISSGCSLGINVALALCHLVKRRAGNIAASSGALAAHHLREWRGNTSGEVILATGSW